MKATIVKLSQEFSASGLGYFPALHLVSGEGREMKMTPMGLGVMDDDSAPGILEDFHRISHGD